MPVILNRHATLLIKKRSLRDDPGKSKLLFTARRNGTAPGMGTNFSQTTPGFSKEFHVLKSKNSWT